MVPSSLNDGPCSTNYARSINQHQKEKSKKMETPRGFNMEGVSMRTIVLLTSGSFILSNLALSEPFNGSNARIRSAQATDSRVCEQVISCGTKDGKRKQYPTPCAARDDGATNITPKTGPTCDESK
jgi:hypothetical protein